MYWLVAVILAVGLFIVVTYNSLIGKRNKVNNSWSQVDVQLKRRFDLIPNLVETVKGYAGHERDTFEAVVDARNKYLASKTPEEVIEANNEANRVLGRLFALSESYPELKANTNFLELQKQLAETENRITFSRQFYNDVVMEYNNSVQMFPGNLIAGSFGFKQAAFFNIDDGEKSVPNISF